MKTLPRIKSIKTTGPWVAEVAWIGGGRDIVDLSGWIATGGELLAALNEPGTFKTARVGEHGASIEWGTDDDLAIDAYHLSRIAAEQRDVGPNELAAWQAANNFTDKESARVFGVGRSTWAAYKACAEKVPAVVRVMIRATQRDPVLLHAHFKPLKGKAGRPAKAAP
jgi:hypothetical protein